MKEPSLNLPPLSVRNLQRKIPIDRKALELFARRALPLCARMRGACLTSISEISVVFVSDRRMSALHWRFMQLRGPTDVITFQHGDIFISVETARRQALTYGTSLPEELRLYLVHGLLHLCGFDDGTPIARRRMEAAQRKVIERACAEQG